MKSKVKTVVVRWVDSYHNTGWKDSSELPDLDSADFAECVTVGLLVSETKQFIRVALSYGAPEMPLVKGSYGHFISIPKVSIKSIKRGCL